MLVAIAIMVMMAFSDNNRMNRINDPNRLRWASIALPAMTVTTASVGIGAVRGNDEDARSAGERRGSQHCSKGSRTIHFVLHLIVCWAASANPSRPRLSSFINFCRLTCRAFPRKRDTSSGRRGFLADQTTSGLGSDDNGLDNADAAAIDEANRQGPADSLVCSHLPLGQDRGQFIKRCYRLRR
jgi:hypothetical protein